MEHGTYEVKRIGGWYRTAKGQKRTVYVGAELTKRELRVREESER